MASEAMQVSRQHSDYVAEPLLEAVQSHVSTECMWGAIGFHPHRTGNLHGASGCPLPILFLLRPDFPDLLERELGADKMRSAHEARFWIVDWEQTSSLRDPNAGLQRVRDRLYRLQIALRICGVTFRWFDLLLTGKQTSNHLVSWNKELLPLTGIPVTLERRVFSDTSLAEAWSLVSAIEHLESSGEFERLKNSWGALIRGLREEHNPWEAVHQYVRVLEGLTGGGSDRFGAEDFGKMLDPHIKSTPGDLKRSYQLRNLVEHMKPMDSLPKVWGKENLTADQALQRAQKLADWLEVVACRMMIRFLTYRNARTKLSGTSGLIELLDPQVIAREWPHKIDVARIWREWRREAERAGYGAEEYED